MPHFFADDNLINTLCSVHVQLHQSMLTNIKSYKSNIIVTQWTKIDQLLSFINNLKFFIYVVHVSAYHTEDDLGPCNI